MKKLVSIISSTLFCMNVFSQTNLLLVRQDTTLLKAAECNWLIGQGAGSGDPGKSIGLFILEQIQAGRLNARDPQTNEMIPGNKIMTWRQAADTVMVWDEKKQENSIKVIQHQVKPEDISRARIYHDWYLDTETGKIHSTVKSVELLIDVYAPMGELRGYRPFCWLE